MDEPKRKRRRKADVVPLFYEPPATNPTLILKPVKTYSKKSAVRPQISVQSKHGETALTKISSTETTSNSLPKSLYSNEIFYSRAKHVDETINKYVLKRSKKSIVKHGPTTSKKLTNSPSVSIDLTGVSESVAELSTLKDVSTPSKKLTKVDVSPSVSADLTGVSQSVTEPTTKSTLKDVSTPSKLYKKLIKVPDPSSLVTKSPFVVKNSPSLAITEPNDVPTTTKKLTEVDVSPSLDSQSVSKVPSVLTCSSSSPGVVKISSKLPKNQDVFDSPPVSHSPRLINLLTKPDHWFFDRLVKMSKLPELNRDKIKVLSGTPSLQVTDHKSTVSGVNKLVIEKSLLKTNDRLYNTHKIMKLKRFGNNDKNVEDTSSKETVSDGVKVKIEPTEIDENSDGTEMIDEASIKTENIDEFTEERLDTLEETVVSSYTGKNEMIDAGPSTSIKIKREIDNDIDIEVHSIIPGADDNADVYMQLQSMQTETDEKTIGDVKVESILTQPKEKTEINIKVESTSRKDKKTDGLGEVKSITPETDDKTDVASVKSDVEIKIKKEAEAEKELLDILYERNVELTNTLIDSVQVKIEPNDMENEDDIIQLNEPKKKAKKLHYCKKCDYVGPIKEFREHVKDCTRTTEVKSNTLSYKCINCEMESTDLRDYLRHLPIHDYLRGQCPACHEKLENNHKLAEHVLQHIKSDFRKITYIDKGEKNQIKKFRCSNCRSILNQKDFFPHWQSHFTTHKPTEVDTVTEYDTLSITNGERKLLVQTLKSKIGKIKVCPKCARTFNRNNDVKRHIIQHLLADAYVFRIKFNTLLCQICGVGNSTGELYKRHMRDHALLPLYQCQICDKAFSDSSNFGKHKKVHNLYVFVCDICNAKFQCKLMLEKHLKAHEETKPMKCEVCAKTFFFESQYKKHMRSIHYGLIAFACTVCRHRFKSLKEKWDHEWEVHKMRKYEMDCPVCNEQFRNYSQTRRHMSKTHNIDISEFQKKYKKQMDEKLKEVKNRIKEGRASWSTE